MKITTDLSLILIYGSEMISDVTSYTKNYYQSGDDSVSVFSFSLALKDRRPEKAFV